jgi:hypothetical protein
MGAIPATDIAVIERGLVIAGTGWSSFVAHMGAIGPEEQIFAAVGQARMMV